MNATPMAALALLLCLLPTVPAFQGVATPHLALLHYGARSYSPMEGRRPSGFVVAPTARPAAYLPHMALGQGNAESSTPFWRVFRFPFAASRPSSTTTARRVASASPAWSPSADTSYIPSDAIGRGPPPQRAPASPPPMPKGVVSHFDMPAAVRQRIASSKRATPSVEDAASPMQHAAVAQADAPSGAVAIAAPPKKTLASYIMAFIAPTAPPPVPAATPSPSDASGEAALHPAAAFLLSCIYPVADIAASSTDTIAPTPSAAAAPPAPSALATAPAPPAPAPAPTPPRKVQSFGRVYTRAPQQPPSATVLHAARAPPPPTAIAPPPPPPRDAAPAPPVARERERSFLGRMYTRAREPVVQEVAELREVEEVEEDAPEAARALSFVEEAASPADASPPNALANVSPANALADALATAAPAAAVILPDAAAAVTLREPASAAVSLAEPVALAAPSHAASTVEDVSTAQARGGAQVRSTGPFLHSRTVDVVGVTLGVAAEGVGLCADLTRSLAEWLGGL